MDDESKSLLDYALRESLLSIQEAIELTENNDATKALSIRLRHCKRDIELILGEPIE